MNSISRTELYRLVWHEAPPHRLVARLGVSDTAIRKLCRRLNCPVPYSGYWLAKERGSHQALDVLVCDAQHVRRNTVILCAFASIEDYGPPPFLAQESQVFPPYKVRSVDLDLLRDLAPNRHKASTAK